MTTTSGGGTLSLIHGNALAIPLADQSVHLVVTSPPYHSLRSYRDGDEHFDGQLGSEETPHHFLAALWAVLDECWRVLRDDGSCWVNLGDRFAGSGGHNNDGISKHGTGKSTLQGNGKPDVARRAALAEQIKATRRSAPDRYNQNTGGLRPKSRMLLPGRFAHGLIDPAYRRFEEERAGPDVVAMTRRRILDRMRADGELTHHEWMQQTLLEDVDARGEPVCSPVAAERLDAWYASHQWICRMDAVWDKKNGLPESVTDRVRASHEGWFHLTKSERYFAAMDEVREVQTGPEFTGKAGVNRPGVTHQTSTDGLSHRRVAMRDREYNQLGKLPGSVWSVATEPLSIPEFMVARYPGELEPTWLDEKAAWRWMRDTGNDSSPWPQTPEDGRQLRAAPAHFAAFPSEFPRRIVLGWSPSGVCVACGQPRRPICEKTGRIVSSRGDAILGPEVVQDARTKAMGQGEMVRGAAGYAFPKHETVVTGYACACPTPDAPTRPSVVVDPFSGTGTAPIVAAAMGRHGVGVDLSWDYHRIARWRDRDGGLRAKALGVDRPERQVPGQLSLLDGAPKWLSSRPMTARRSCSGD